MPALPSASEWLPSGVVIGVVLFGAMGQDIQALRDDLKAMDTRHREDMREMRSEHRADHKALNAKLDRLVEAC